MKQFLLLLSITAFPFSEMLAQNFANTESNVIEPASKDSLSLGTKKGSSSMNRPSPKSFWIGATLAYNFEGGGTENVVGAANVELAPVKQFSKDSFFNLLVIGNIAKITSAQSEDASQDISDLIQSNQGLSVGIAPVYTFNPSNSNKNYLRAFSTLNYKINGYQNVGSEKETINISQFRGTVGMEFEGFEIEKGGPFNLSVEYIFSAFDNKKYAQVFGQDVGSFSVLEVTLLIPLPGKFGVITSVNYSNQSKPIYQAGIIIQTIEKKP
ncbi:MAG: hypothetical protein ACKV1O_06610 [Saprospiraceae bacterium]